MKTKVKLLAASLAVLMVVVLLPAPAEAVTYTVDDAESFAEALALLDDGDTIKLEADINYTVSTASKAISVAGKSITIDVGDYTLNVTNTYSNSTGLEVNNGKVELVCGTGAFNVTGEIYGVYALNGGEATVTSATGTIDGGYGVLAYGAGSKVTVTGRAQGVLNGAAAMEGGTVIAGSAISTGTGSGNGIFAHGADSSVTVSGEATGYDSGIYAAEGATAAAGSASGTGSVSFGIYVINASVTVTGAVTGVNNGVGLSGGTDVVGSAAGTGTTGIGVNASNGTVTVNGDATGYIAIDAMNSATVTVNGDARGIATGVLALSGASVTVDDAIATGTNSYGAKAVGGSTITVNGDAEGQDYGAWAQGLNSTIIVSGMARASSPTSYGACASDSGIVEAGAAEGGTYGAIAIGASSRVTVSGTVQGTASGAYANLGTVSAGSATSTGDGSFGVFADGGTIEINGNVTGAGYGAWAHNNSTIQVNGAVQGVSYGVFADGSTIVVNGNVTATSGTGTGASARNGSLITINGALTAPYYITVNGIVKTPDQGVEGTDADEGYLVYSEGTDKVRVMQITAVITITGQPAASLNLTEGAISATLTCAAAVDPDGTPSYLWYSCDNPAKENPVSTGVTTATFTIPADLTQGTYYYFCRVSAAGALDVDSNVSTIVVHTASNDAYLSGLVVSDGTLDPDFLNTHYIYTVTVANEVSSITVTPTTNHAAATVIVNGAAVDSGSPSNPIALTEGENTINVVVTAEDGSTQKTYTIIVTRAEPGYLPRTLTDSATGISISGEAIHKDAVLTVGPMDLHPAGTCAACGAIRQRLANDEYTLILGHDIALSYGFNGSITVTIPVGSQYNGKTLTVLHCDEGVLKEFQCKVENGMVSFTVDSLSPVAVLRYSPQPADGLPATGEGFASMVWSLLISLAGTAMLFSLMLKRRKEQSE